MVSSAEPPDDHHRDGPGPSAESAATPHSPLSISEVSSLPQDGQDHSPLRTPSPEQGETVERYLEDERLGQEANLDQIENLAPDVATRSTEEPPDLSHDASTDEEEETVQVLQAAPAPDSTPSNWMPLSLRHRVAVIMFIGTNILLYIALYIVSWRRGYVAVQSDHVNWVFQFGPQFLAVFIYILVARMAKDYEIMEPFIDMASARRSSQPRASKKQRQRQPKTARPLLHDRGFYIPMSTIFLASYIVSIILIPLQATVFKLKRMVVVQAQQPFFSVDADSVAANFIGSNLPDLALGSLFGSDITGSVLEVSHYNNFVTALNGQPFPPGDRYISVDDIVASPYGFTPTFGSLWTEILDLNRWDFSYNQPQSVAVLPFWPQDSALVRSSSQQQPTWGFRGVAVYAALECNQINNIKVSVSTDGGNFVPGPAMCRTFNLTFSMTDASGCELNGSWAYNGVADSAEPSWMYQNGSNSVISRGFRSSVNTSLTASTNPSCTGTHFLFYSPVSMYCPTNGSNKTILVGDGSSSGIGGLSCRSRYYKITPEADFVVRDESTVFYSGDALSHESARPLLSSESDTFNLDRWMLENFWYSGDLSVYRGFNLVRDFGSISFIEKTDYGVNGTRRNRTLPDPREPGCHGVRAGPNAWNNTVACGILKAMIPKWSTAFLYGASAVARLTPPEKLVRKDGLVGQFETVWYMTCFSASAAVVAHVFLCLLLLWHHLKCIGGLRAPREPLRSGLEASPGSLAAKALLFRDPSVRPLFNGLDTVDAKAALALYMSRRATFDLSLEPGTVAETGGKKDAGPPPFVRVSAKEKPLPLPNAAHDSSRLFSRKPVLPVDSTKLAKLLHGEAAWQLHPALLLANFSLAIALVVVVFILIYPGRNRGFRLWAEPVVVGQASDSILDAHNVRLWMHEALFKILPTIVLVALSLWWGFVESFFRETQPYVHLATSARRGRDSVLVDYGFDMGCAISVTAVRRRHWGLAMVTSVTFLVQLATVIAGGIFIAATSPTAPAVDASDLNYPLIEKWRDNKTFGIYGEATNDSRLAFSSALIQSPLTINWATTTHVFLKVDLRDEELSYVALQGIKANLTCVDTPAGFTPFNGSINGTAELLDGDCKGTLWYDVPSAAYGFCFPLVRERGIMPNVDNLTCSAWQYLPADLCTNATAATGRGRYWFMSMVRHLQDTTATSSSSSSSRAPPSYTTFKSTVCTMHYYNETVLSFVTRNNNGSADNTNNKTQILRSVGQDISITTDKVVSSEEVDPNLWSLKQGGDEGRRNLDLHFGEMMGLSFGQITMVSPNVALDKVTLNMALRMSSSGNGSDQFTVNSLGTVGKEAFEESASQTFGLYFAWILGTDSGPGEAPSMFQANAAANSTGPYDATQATYGATVTSTVTVSTVALLTATAIIMIYALSVPLLFFLRRGRYTPKPAGVVANQVSLVYDSSVVQLSEQSWDGKQFRGLGDVWFKLGVFLSDSGARRLGVEVAAKVGAGGLNTSST